MVSGIKLILKILLGKATLLERFSLMTKIAKYILPKYRFKWPQMDWWEDKEL